MKHLKNVHKHFSTRNIISKLTKFSSIFSVVLLLSSCNSVRVASDYDKETQFDNYKTFAFFKPGIDKAEINDIDKRTILKAIETQLVAKGLTKSKNPDILVSMFTKSNQQIKVYNNTWGYGVWGWGGFGGWGWGPGRNGNQVSVKNEGVLFIDLIDANNKQLIWQGSGTGYLVTRNVEKKEARIKEFVTKTMEQFPPAK